MIQIKKLDTMDIPMLVVAFQEVNWHKPTALFEAYYQEQQRLQHHAR